MCWSHIVCTPPLSAGGERAEPPTKVSKSGGLTAPQFLEGVAGKEGVTFFRGGGCNFLTKNKLKSGIFNDKKVYKQEFFVLL